MTGLVDVGRRHLPHAKATEEAGRVLDGRDTDPRTGRLLSLIELQRALQAAQQVARDGGPAMASERHAVDPPNGAPALQPDAHRATPAATTAPAATPQAGLDTGRPGLTAGAAEPGRPASADAGRISGHGADVVVLGVHGGAGASTVALALADAAAVAGRAVHLVSGHAAAGCGLLAVPHVELGSAGSGWRRGRRGDRVLVDRAAGQQPAAGWPSLPVPEGALTVLDSAPGAALDLPPAAVVVLVCRPTVPGVQRSEHVLRQLLEPALDTPRETNEPPHSDDDVDTGLDIIVPRARPSGPRAALLASVGPALWPGEVIATAGPLLRRLLRDGRVLPVPLDRHLGVTGPCGDLLPRAVLKAAAALLQLVDAERAAHAAKGTAAAHPDVCSPRPVVSSPDPDPKDRYWT